MVANNSSIEEWFRSLPIITQYWIGATAAITLAGNLDIIHPMYLLYSWNHIKTKLELWRIITSFCYVGQFQFPTLLTFYTLHSISIAYEKRPFNTGAGGGTADYAFAMLFGMGMILITYPVVTSMFKMPPMFCRNLTHYVMYIWSKRNPEGRSTIWGMPIPGIWLPFASMAFSVFMGNPYVSMLHGFGIGHLYYFLADVIPNVQGRVVLVTPTFLIDRFGVGQYHPQAAAPANNPVPNARPGGQAGPQAAGGAA